MGSITRETSSASSFLSDQQQSPHSLDSDCIDNQSAVTPEGMGQEGSTSMESIVGAESLASTPRPFDDDDCVLVLDHTPSCQPAEDQGRLTAEITRVSLGISAEINMDGIGIGEDGNAKMTVAEGSEYDGTGYLDRALPGIPTTPSIYEECTESNNYGQDGTLSLHLSETPTDTTSSSYHSVTFPSTDYFSPSPSNPSSCSDSTTPTSTRPRLRLASLSPSTSTQVTDKPLSDSPPLPFQQPTSSPWQLSSSTSSRDHSASSSQSSLLDPGGITRFEVADVEARPNGVVHFSEGRADDKRYHALLELVETEAGYLQSLRILVKVYFASLPIITSLSSRSIAAVVRNSEALLELHERIAVKLDSINADLCWKEVKVGIHDESLVCQAAGMIAQVFNEELPNFALYNSFCALHGEALDIIRHFQSSPDWPTYEYYCADAAHITLMSSTSMPVLHQTSSTSSSTTLPSSSSLLQSSSTVAKSKLRYQDYAIKPIQRVCRYPMVFGQLIKHLGTSQEKQVVCQVWEGMKKTAEEVDESKRRRECYTRTKLVANRMEFHSSIHWAFCDILGPTLLISTLNVLHRSQISESLRVKYYGCFLYKTHIVMAKVKKRSSYEPREWLPLRLVELSDLDEGDGILPHSFRISFRDHHFDFGASCAAEKQIWITLLTASQAESKQTWANQSFDKDGCSTRFDDSGISSVPPPRAEQAPSTSSPSSPIVAPALSHAFSAPGLFAAGMLQSEPSSPIFSSASFPLIPVPTRNRFSTTASALIGRTTAAQRAAIDIRLSDVTSSECLAARIQATQSRPTRSSTGVLRPSKVWTKELRRMSYVEGSGKAQAQARKDLLRDGAWDSDVFPTKKISLDSRLPSQRFSMEGETSVVQSVRAKTSVWKGRAVSRTLSLKQATTLILTSNEPLRVVHDQRPSLDPIAARTSTADVERNSSVSSSTSSSGTSRDTSHSSATSIGTQITPASSVPPSPTTAYLELDIDLQKNPSSGIGYSPIRRRTSSIIGSVRRLSRQSSGADIASGASTPPQMESTPSSNSLSSMIGTLLSGSRRSRSSPSLSTHFDLADPFAARYIMPPPPNVPLGPRLPSLDFSPTVRIPAVLHKPPPVTTDRSVAGVFQSTTKKSTTAAPKATSRFFFRKLTPLHPPPATP